MRPMQADITFNIIYVGGTVRTLAPFVPTLLKHSDCRFRLVSNGCSEEEERELQALCSSPHRLSFYSLGSPTVLVHGTVLNQLLREEQAPYFAFMDSDIFATGPFMERHLASLEQHTAVFSCLPWWYEPHQGVMPASFTVMAGRYYGDETGRVVGTTYFAIYKRQALDEAISATGVGFERYFWKDIAARQRSLLKAIKLRKTLYDTGKLLNIMLAEHGGSLVFDETPALVHLGGMSISKDSPVKPPAGVADRLYALLSRAMLRLRWKIHNRNIRSKPRQEKETRSLLAERRQHMQVYINALINNSGEDADLSEHLAQLPQTVQERLLDLARQMRDIHKAYRQQAHNRQAEPVAVAE